MVMRHPCYQRVLGPCSSVSETVMMRRNHVAVVHVEVKSLEVQTRLPPIELNEKEPCWQDSETWSSERENF